MQTTISGDVDILAANTFPIGILPDMGNIETQKVPKQAGDVTDGSYEWSRADEERFSVERVRELYYNLGVLVSLWLNCYKKNSLTQNICFVNLTS